MSRKAAIFTTSPEEAVVLERAVDILMSLTEKTEVGSISSLLNPMIRKRMNTVQDNRVQSYPFMATLWQGDEASTDNASMAAATGVQHANGLSGVFDTLMAFMAQRVPGLSTVDPVAFRADLDRRIPTIRVGMSRANYATVRVPFTVQVQVASLRHDDIVAVRPEQWLLMFNVAQPQHAASIKQLVEEFK